MDINSETFVMHVAIQKREKMPVHSKKQAQIGVLLFDKALIEVLAEYSDYNNVFSAENAVEFPENTKINEYAIKFKENKQLSFGPIYHLGPVKLKTLKTCIKTHLANSFIWPSKSLTETSIFFDRKPDRSLRICVNH